MHRDVKQRLGLSEPQNGWWRCLAGQRPRKKNPGHQAHPLRGKLASTRTVPFIFTVYALVIIRYFQYGCPTDDVARVRLGDRLMETYPCPKLGFPRITQYARIEVEWMTFLH